MGDENINGYNVHYFTFTPFHSHKSSILVIR